MSKKVSPLLVRLVVLFTSCLIISNILANRMIQVGPWSMDAGNLLFPITYILSDVFSEVYGYQYSRFTNNLGIIMNLLAVILFTVAIYLPSPSFYTGQEAFAFTLGSTPKMLIASYLGLYVGDYINDNVFRIMKKGKEGLDGFGWRAIASSIAGQLGDSLIFIPIAFIGQMPLSVMLTMMFTQAFLKVGYEIIIVPISSKVVKKVSDYEGDK